MRSNLHKLLGSEEMVDKILSLLSVASGLSSSFLMRKFKITFGLAQEIVKIIKKSQDVSRDQNRGFLFHILPGDG